MNFTTTLSQLEKNKQKIVLLFFCSFFCVGLFIFMDFGMSWDERYQREGNGYTNFNYIAHGDETPLLNSADKYHGPAFELALVFAEKIFHLTDLRDIFLVRHLITFLVFYISSLFFYFLSLRLFKSWRLALLGFLFYVLSPHIFSHAFYNSKDPVFLSFFTISIFFMFYFLEKKTIWRAFVFALITAFTIDIRIVGVVIPCFCLYLIGIEFLKNKREKVTDKKIKWLPLLTFFVFLISAVILFWPVLWINPLYHFKAALIENSNYPWDDLVLYFGNEYKPKDLPWHYLFFWMFVSRPIIYSFFLIVATFNLGWQFISNSQKFIFEKTQEQIILLWFFFPFLAMLVFKSPAFDTGRHLYFMHGAFVLLSLYGVKSIWLFISKKKYFGFTFLTIIALSFIGVIVDMITLHPYEHLYFNESQSVDLRERKNNFEFDYWGLSAREALEHLLKIDTSKLLLIQAENLPIQLNAYLLKPAERSRICFTDMAEGAQYFIGNYRWHKYYRFKKEIYSTVVRKAKTTTVFKIRTTKELYELKNKKQQMNFEQNFEEVKQGWTQNQITEPLTGAHSGKKCTKVDSTNKYSDTFVWNEFSKLAGNKNLLLKTSFWIYNKEAVSKSKFILSIETKDGKAYFWYPINEIINETKMNWKQIFGAVELPVIKNKDDILKIYLLNDCNKEILLDDIKIVFEEES